MTKGWDHAWEARLRERAFASLTEPRDPSHDELHIERVVAVAKRLATEEGADLWVVVPAAYLHDIVAYEKSDLRRSQASRHSAQAASEFLKSIGYPTEKIPAIAHAIEAHSFSANIAICSVEAGVVQDADRLDGIGALGIARMFVVAGRLGRPLYDPNDVFAESRDLNDAVYTVDHFYRKLLKIPERMNTRAGRVEAKRRLVTMQDYLAALRAELASLDSTESTFARIRPE